jgi:NADPH-dependent 2,4-dienoyl-CoA reductase/sulfur reductase-like enzyme
LADIKAPETRFGAQAALQPAKHRAGSHGKLPSPDASTAVASCIAGGRYCGRLFADCRGGQPNVEQHDMTKSDVLVVGAGPTGLVLALWLSRLGIKARIIDKTAEPGTTSE